MQASWNGLNTKQVIEGPDIQGFTIWKLLMLKDSKKLMELHRE